MRAAKFIPQIKDNRLATPQQVRSGVELVGLGLIKKVVIADNLAPIADACFAQPGAYNSSALAVGMFAFIGQIYCDFSGYSTMARGLGRMLGFELPRNFNYPLLAKNPIESMTGWHITMNQWFRDYVYLPMAVGRRWLRTRRIAATMVTWGLFGLWHGAAWTFIVWGLFNGLRIVIYRSTKRQLRVIRTLPGAAIASRGLTLLVFSFTCVIFRSYNLSTAKVYFDKLLSFTAEGRAISLGWTWFLVGLLLVHIASKRWYEEDLMARLSPSGRVALVAVMAVLVTIFTGSEKPYIYFQF